MILFSLISFDWLSNRELDSFLWRTVHVALLLLMTLRGGQNDWLIALTSHFSQSSMWVFARKIAFCAYNPMHVQQNSRREARKWVKLFCCYDSLSRLRLIYCIIYCWWLTLSRHDRATMRTENIELIDASVSSVQKLFLFMTNERNLIDVHFEHFIHRFFWPAATWHHSRLQRLCASQCIYLQKAWWSFHSQHFCVSMPNLNFIEGFHSSLRLGHYS